MNNNIGITVCLGDSITKGYEVKNEDCWVSALPNAINRGINGDSTDGMQNRFQAHVLRSHPERVIILGGMNDIGRGCDWTEVASNLEDMCTTAMQHGIQPILATYVTPDYDRFFGADPASFSPTMLLVSQRLRRLHEWIREYCTKNHLICLDFEKEFPTRIQMEYSRYFIDGVHPNSFGYAIMREIALETLHI